LSRCGRAGSRSPSDYRAGGPVALPALKKRAKGLHAWRTVQRAAQLRRVTYLLPGKKDEPEMRML
jgi:hypothetical protein